MTQPIELRFNVDAVLGNETVESVLSEFCKIFPTLQRFHEAFPKDVVGCHMPRMKYIDEDPARANNLHPFWSSDRPFPLNCYEFRNIIQNYIHGSETRTATQSSARTKHLLKSNSFKSHMMVMVTHEYQQRLYTTLFAVKKSKDIYYVTI